MNMTVSMTNEGFGKLDDPRPIVVVLRDTSGVERRIQVVADARLVLPAPGTNVNVDLSITVPDDLVAGTYRIGVTLPDASPKIANDPRYAVRFANDVTWQAQTGANDLILDVVVSPTAP